MKSLRNRHSDERVRQVVDFKDQESLTHQCHAESCDINKILTKFAIQKVGLPEQGEQQYADISELQQADPATQIIKSRQVLDSAGREIEQKKLDEINAKKEAEKQIIEENQKLKEKIAEFEAKNTSNPPRS